MVRIKSKFTSHINSTYLSDIYEEIIHHFSHVGFVLWHKRLCYRGGLETVDLQHIDVPANTAQSPNVGLMSTNVANIKTALGQFLVGVVSCNQFSRWY